MCGILLVVGEQWREDFPVALATLRARGPDAMETLSHGEALLGHTRLAVIDLAGGHQPLVSPDGRFAISYNGEIYNFRALRRELEALGHTFATASDSEVLLKAYCQWGEDALSRFDGMFAFVVYDRLHRSVFAARDRLGIKPLFWGEREGGIIIASTLAPFFALRAFPKRLDVEGLRDYLAFQAPLAPHTILRDVHALPPGACLRWQVDSGALLRQWWTIPHASEKSSPPELIEELDETLAASVRAQLVADVPLGAFLSGGIDSSLVVHYAALAGVNSLMTFSVRFAEAGFDESEAARRVAQKYGCEHHVFDAPDISADMLATALGDLDQPLADPAYVPTWALARLTRRHVTVVLTGDGGDELFAGYARFLETADKYPDSMAKRWLRALIRRKWLPASLTRRSLAGAERLLYGRVEVGNYVESRKDIRRYLHENLIGQLQPEKTLLRWRELVEGYGNYDRHALLRADLWTYLSENCLVKTDRATMAHGLEARVPLLGKALVERMLALPAEVHFDTCGGKALLRALARRHLPEIVWNRPKHGFSVPLRGYLAGPWREWSEAQLATAKIHAPWLNHQALRRLWSSVAQGKGSARLFYTLLVLLTWLSRHRVET
ncbi:MAG: asparagine synthase (glutamine-hydrolyzing) [Rhodocyclaceae bacterium]|nr:asparagine synthase (glutamine-hydrolyzing) [Rhodocyclaceae bacterium]